MTQFTIEKMAQFEAELGRIEAENEKDMEDLGRDFRNLFDHLKSRA